MDRFLGRALHAAMTLSWAVALASCASTPSATDEESVESPGQFTPIELARGPIGPMVRELGQRTGRSIVVMNGIEYHHAGPYSLNDTSAADIVKRIAADSGMALTRAAGYDFIHAPGFEGLNAFAPSSSMDRSAARITATVRLGADTPVYGALALLGQAYRVTLVADNVVASALCGETALHDVPLGVALDAILRSARLSGATCRVRADGATMFFSSPSASQRDRIFVNSPGQPRPRTLDRRVTLYLPARPPDANRLVEASDATPLSQCLASLGEQLGMKVEADRRSGILPVNPCVIVDVPLETAMRLIIQQWPLPHYGYTASDDTIRFVYLGPPAD